MKRFTILYDLIPCQWLIAKEVFQIMKLDVILDNHLELLAIYDNEFEVYSVLNMNKSKMIYTLIHHPDSTFDITIRDK